MKKKITIGLLSLLVVLISHNTGNTQVTIRSSEGTVDMVTANNLSARIINLFVLDSLVPGGQTNESNNPLMHLAVFELELGSSAATNMLKQFYSAMQGQQLQGLTITKVSTQGRIVERREYNTISVKEIILPELKTDIRGETAKAKITLQADNVLYDNSPGGYASTSFDKTERMRAGSNFRLEIGNLPTQKAMRVSTIKMVPSSNTGYLYFTVDIPLEDARQWNDWLRANNNGGGNQTPQATISLMDERLQQTLSVQIAQVEIISISAMSIPSSVPKITIGLRTTTPPAIY